MDLNQFSEKTSIETLISACMGVADVNGLQVVQAHHPDEKLGYVWVDTARDEIHFFPTTIGDWVRDEVAVKDRQQFYSYQTILELIERECNLEIEGDRRAIVYAVFTVFHEIGHCVDSAQDRDDYAKRYEQRHKDLLKLQTLARVHANVGEQLGYINPDDVFRPLEKNYRELPCENTADQYALKQIKPFLREYLKRK